MDICLGYLVLKVPIVIKTYLYNTHTTVMWTLESDTLVSMSVTFDCNSVHTVPVKCKLILNRPMGRCWEKGGGRRVGRKGWGIDGI